MESIDVQKLFNLGGHFGHKLSRTNPKAKRYIYKTQNGVAIIDLFATKTLTEEAMKALFEAGKSGKQLLLVATKKNVQRFATELGKKEKIHYLTEKWVGGFFTNFEEIKKNIDRINGWIADRDSGVWNEMIKHERNKLEKELNKMLRIYAGVLEMDRIPDAVLIVDVKKEKNALAESRKVQELRSLQGKEPLLTASILDTNANPEDVNYPVMINDDTSPILEYLLTNLVEQYSAGRKLYRDAEKKREEKKVKDEKKDEQHRADKKTA